MVFLVAVVFNGCSEGDEHGEEGEESGTRFTLDETHDEVRGGARLILEYDSESNTFIGTVENVTEEALDRVRVEVHLSNGTEVGSDEHGGGCDGEHS